MERPDGTRSARPSSARESSPQSSPPIGGIRNYSQSLPSSALAQFSQRHRLSVNTRTVMAPASPPPSECLPRIRDYFSIRKSTATSSPTAQNQQALRRPSLNPSQIDVISDLDLLTRQELIDLITALSTSSAPNLTAPTTSCVEADISIPSHLRRLVDQRKQVPHSCKHHSDYYTSPFLLPSTPPATAGSEDMDELSLCSAGTGGKSPVSSMATFSISCAFDSSVDSGGNCKGLVEWARNLSIDKVIERSNSPKPFASQLSAGDTAQSKQQHLTTIPVSPPPPDITLPPPSQPRTTDQSLAEENLPLPSGEGAQKLNDNSTVDSLAETRLSTGSAAHSSVIKPDPVGELNQLLNEASTIDLEPFVPRPQLQPAALKLTLTTLATQPQCVASANSQTTPDTSGESITSTDNNNNMNDMKDAGDKPNGKPLVEDIREILVAIELYLDDSSGFPVAARYLCPLFSKHTKANRCDLALQTQFNSNQVMADMEKSRPVWVIGTAGYDEEEINVYLKIECRRTGIRAFCSLLDIQRDIYSFSDRVDNGGKWTRLAEARLQLYSLRRANKWYE